MISILLAALLGAQGQQVGKHSGNWVQVPSPTSPSLNAVLYAAFNAPGCYATGSTALAVDGSGNSVAATFSRSSGTDYYRDNPPHQFTSCPAGQIGISGLHGLSLQAWTGVNQLSAPTDSPTSSGAWSVIGAGTVVTANQPTFADGSATASVIASAGGTVSGIQQTWTAPGTSYYSASGFVSEITSFGGPSNPYCMAITLASSVDTAMAKLDARLESWTYLAPGVKAGVEQAGHDWVYWWIISPSIPSGSQTYQIWEDNDCSNNSQGAIVAANQYMKIGRLMVSHPNNGTVAAYTGGGANRTADYLYFPVNVNPSTTGITLKAALDPMNVPWTQRSVGGNQTKIGGLYVSTTTQGAANSLLMYVTTSSLTCTVYDNTATSKTVTTGISADDKSHVVSCGTDGSGNITAGIDGGAGRVTVSGTGTGIITGTLTKAYVGSLSSADVGAGLPVGISDYIVCATADPTVCGSWSTTQPTWIGVLGDSNTSTVGPTTPYTTSWTVTAATTLGGTYRVANFAVDGSTSINALQDWTVGARAHRFAKVAVMLGTNDVQLANYSAAQAMSYLRQIYRQILASGAQPVLMTVFPTSTMNATQNAERLRLNVAIMNEAAQNGFKVADVGTYVDDGYWGGTWGQIRTIWANADQLHLNDAGEAAVGVFMAPYLQ